MRKPKLTFFFFYKYNKIYEHRFNIKKLSKNFDLSILDLSRIFSSHLKKNIKRASFKKLFVIKDLSELKKRIDFIKPDFCILDGPQQYEIKIKNLFVEKNINTKIVQFHLGQTPDDIPEYNFYSNKKILFSLKLFKFMTQIFHSVFKKFLSKKSNKNIISKIDYFFFAGKDTLKNEKFSNFNIKKKISVPSFDYDFVLRKKKQLSIPLIKKKYSVFLDSMLMHHDDYKSTKRNYPVTKKYFTELDRFFSTYENKNKIEVIIALHPSCNISNYRKYFNGRRCIKNQSANLVKYAENVFLHASTTAVNFPIIFKKPIIYLTTDELNNSFIDYKRLLIRKKIFKHNFINISKINSIKTIKFKIDKKIYKRFHLNYISGILDEKKKISDYFIENLKI